MPQLMEPELPASPRHFHHLKALRNAYDLKTRITGTHLTDFIPDLVFSAEGKSFAEEERKEKGDCKVEVYNICELFRACDWITYEGHSSYPPATAAKVGRDLAACHHSPLAVGQARQIHLTLLTLSMKRKPRPTIARAAGRSDAQKTSPSRQP